MNNKVRGLVVVEDVCPRRPVVIQHILLHTSTDETVFGTRFGRQNVLHASSRWHGFEFRPTTHCDCRSGVYDIVVYGVESERRDDLG